MGEHCIFYGGFLSFFLYHCGRGWTGTARMVAPGPGGGFLVRASVLSMAKLWVVVVGCVCGRWEWGLCGGVWCGWWGTW